MKINIAVTLVGNSFKAEDIQKAVQPVFKSWLKDPSCPFLKNKEFSCVVTDDGETAVTAETGSNVVVLISPLRPRVTLTAKTIVIDDPQRFGVLLRAGLKNWNHKNKKK